MRNRILAFITACFLLSSASPSFALAYNVPDSPQRQHLRAELKQACGTISESAFADARLDVNFFSYAKADPQTYKCFADWIKNRWALVSQNNSPAMLDYRNKCAADRKWLADQIVLMGSSYGVTAGQAYASVDHFFMLQPDDPTVLQASISEAQQKAGGRVNLEVRLYVCQAQTRIEQLNSGQNTELSR